MCHVVCAGLLSCHSAEIDFFSLQNLFLSATLTLALLEPDQSHHHKGAFVGFAPPNKAPSPLKFKYETL